MYTDEHMSHEYDQLRMFLHKTWSAWTINPEPFLNCKGTKIPSTTVTSFCKYLGIKVEVMSNSGFISDNLEKKLHDVIKHLRSPNSGYVRLTYI